MVYWNTFHTTSTTFRQKLIFAVGRGRNWERLWADHPVGLQQWSWLVAASVRIFRQRGAENGIQAICRRGGADAHGRCPGVDRLYRSHDPGSKWYHQALLVQVELTHGFCLMTPVASGLPSLWHLFQQKKLFASLSVPTKVRELSLGDSEQPNLGHFSTPATSVCGCRAWMHWQHSLFQAPRGR